MCKNVTFFISITQFDFLTLGILYNERQLNLDAVQVALSKSHIFQSIPVWNTVIIRVTPICLLPWPHPSGVIQRAPGWVWYRVHYVWNLIWMGSKLVSLRILMSRPSWVPGTGGPTSLDYYWKWFTPNMLCSALGKSQRVFLSTHFIILRGHWKVQYPCLFHQRGVRDSAGLSLEFFLPGPIPHPCIYPLTMPLCQGVHWWGRVPEVKRYYSRILNSDSAKSTNVKNW